MKTTPMIQQYLMIKERYCDCILFFRMGDFYEMFFEDAVLASRILDIALTSRDKKSKNPVPMCGVPYHAASQYVNKLTRQGHKVAVCEQIEDPKAAKGIVKREVVRVITPGVPADTEEIEPKDHNYLISLMPNGRLWGLACVDPTTGDISVTEVMGEEELESELTRLEPKEILLPQKTEKSGTAQMLNRYLRSPFYTYMEDSLYEKRFLLDTLKDHFGSEWFENFNADGFEEGLCASGILIHYLKETQKRAPLYLKPPSLYRVREYMIIDPMTRRNLELIESIQDGSRSCSLLGVLDMTQTAMGGRRLREWISFPLINTSEISLRLDSVSELKGDRILRGGVIEELKGICDIERLINRIMLRSAKPPDLVSLKLSLGRLPSLKTIIGGCSSEYIKRINENIDIHNDIIDLVSEAILDEPSVMLKDGGIIRDGYNKELDELRNISRSGKAWMLRYEQEERKNTGINSLKVRYNKVFGYYIEVTAANLQNVPDRYIRKQTLVNGERFITQELKEYETKVLTAHESIIELEKRLFNEILESIAEQISLLQNTAFYIGLLDVVSSLALVADERGYSRPVVDEGTQISIMDGRHPVVETMSVVEGFVANDTMLDCNENRLLIITGPNMAGKSTYIRQVALIVLMAQIGSFVPALEARVGVVDRIFARIGAMDDIARGRSTFMVEMSETAHILRCATERSLIVLDEIGRGTSTFDGISIAWAVAEYVLERGNLAARTLFATHYHELTELSLVKDGVKNYNVSVKEWNDRIIFLRKIVPGSSNRSYGIQVARLAGIPKEVVKRAKAILSNFEKGELNQRVLSRFSDGMTEENTTDQRQLNLFSMSEHPVINELRTIDVTNLTPVDALNKLYQLQKMLEEGV